MAAIRAGIAVLVVGPTVTGGRQAIGHTGAVDRWVLGEEALPEWCGDVAARAGWVVAFDRPVAAFGNGRFGIFPASSLMPLNGQAEPEAITTTAPAVAHA
jgi:hypothetical protein